jgi:hypothetical protein
MASLSWPQQTAIFPKFLQLPAELQLLIWDFAIPATDARVITYSQNHNYIRYDWRSTRSTCLHKATYTNPGILGACYDSRLKALKRYTPSFAIEIGHPIYVDFSRDTFEFGDFASLEAFSIKNTPFSGSKMEGDCILTVGITLEQPLREHHFILLCSNFGGMKRLMVRERNWWKLETEPLAEFGGEEIERTWPWVTGRIRRNIESRGGDWSAWKPPIVTRGTEEQWEYWMSDRGRYGVEEMEWEPLGKVKEVKGQ